jgi:ethanolaminephosphotransferase
MIGVYAFTAYVGGASFWQQSALNTLGVPNHALIPNYIYELPFNEVWMYTGGSVLVLNTIQSYV